MNESNRFTRTACANCASLWLLGGVVLALAGCGGKQASDRNASTAGSPATASASEANYGPEDPRNPSYWRPAARSVASDFDIAGVKLDMTIDDAVDALQANGFQTFTDTTPSPPKDNEDLGGAGQFELDAKNKTNPDITVQVLFLGSPDKSAKWSMGDGMRVSLIDYDQELPNTDDETSVRAIDTLVQKAGSKYGQTGQLILQPLNSNDAILSVWGDEASRNIYSKHSDFPPLHFTNEGRAGFLNFASSPLDGEYDPQLKQCEQLDPQGKASDAVLNCMKPLWAKEHAAARRLAPTLLAGPFSQVAAPAFHLVLFSPYKTFMYRQDHQSLLDANKVWRQEQAAATAAVGNTAF